MFSLIYQTKSSKTNLHHVVVWYQLAYFRNLYKWDRSYREWRIIFFRMQADTSCIGIVRNISCFSRFRDRRKLLLGGRVRSWRVVGLLSLCNRCSRGWISPFFSFYEFENFCLWSRPTWLWTGFLGWIVLGKVFMTYDIKENGWGWRKVKIKV